MPDPSYQRRFERAANDDPGGFAQYTQQRLGHSPEVAQGLLAIHRHLVDGNKVTPQHVRQLQAAHPYVDGRQIAQMAHALNQQPPGERASIYLGCLAGDVPAMSGNYADAGPVFKELQSFTEAYHRESVAAEINARREQNIDPDMQRRQIERPQEDPMSTRNLIARQLEGDEGKAARYINDRVEAGDPDMLRAVAGNLADTGERALEKLEDPEASTRDTVAAAFAYHEVEAVAQDQGLVSQEQE
jgi:hypothetical protein